MGIGSDCFLEGLELSTCSLYTHTPKAGLQDPIPIYTQGQLFTTTGINVQEGSPSQGTLAVSVLCLGNGASNLNFHFICMQR